MTLPFPAGTRRSASLQHNVRYIVVGATCAVLNNLLLIGLVHTGLSVIVANVIALVPMIVIGYGLHVTFTFGVRPSITGFARFSAGLIAALPLSVLVLFVLVDLLHVPIAPAAPIGSAVVFAWTYVATHMAIREPRRGRCADTQEARIVDEPSCFRIPVI